MQLFILAFCVSLIKGNFCLITSTILLSHTSPDAKCLDNWFGPECQFMCHCQTQCQDDGSCSKCQAGWFGYNCQYLDLVMAENATIKLHPPGHSTDWLTDRNESTCNGQENLQSITVIWDSPNLITWSDLIFATEFSAILRGVKVTVIDKNKETIKCSKRTLDQQKKKLRYKCNVVYTKQLILTGEEISSLCGLYVSGGKKLALKGIVIPSSTESSNVAFANLSVNGNQGECMPTEGFGDHPSYTVHLKNKTMISRLVIFSKGSEHSSRKKDFRLDVFNDKGISVYTYRNSSETHVHYTIVPESYLPASKVRISIGKYYQTLCKLEVYGDCPSNVWDLACDRFCPRNCSKKCFVESGRCPTYSTFEQKLQKILNKCDQTKREQTKWTEKNKKECELELQYLIKKGMHKNENEFNTFTSVLAEGILNFVKNQSTTETDITQTVVEVLIMVENKTSQEGFYLDNGTFHKLVTLADNATPSSQESWTQGSQGEIVSINALAGSLEGVVSNTMRNNKTKDTSIVKKNIAIEIGVAYKDIHYPNRNKTTSTWIKDSNNTLFLSRDAFSKFNRQAMNVKYSLLMIKNPSKNLKQYNHRNISLKVQTERIVSDIMALSVNVSLNTTLSSPVKMTFSIKQKKRSKLFCVFLDTSLSPNGLWSNTGCHTVSIQNDYVDCSCNHLTSFAVLMSLRESQHHKVLTALTTAGCSASIFCLSVTIIIYYVLWRHIKSERSVLLINLCISMLVGYVVYIVGIDRTETKVMCTVFAVVLHYCFLLVFFNFLSQSLALYTSLNNMTGKTYLKFFLPFTYVCPLIIVVTTMAVTGLEGYGTTRYCWLSKERGLIWSFIGPVIVVLIINLVVLVLVIQLYLATRGVMEQTNAARTMSVIRAIIVLVPLFGVTWVFGLMSIYNNHIVLQYLFVILNTLQGLFIFVFHCMNHRQIKEAFKSFRRRRKAQSLETTPKNTYVLSN